MGHQALIFCRIWCHKRARNCSAGESLGWRRPRLMIQNLCPTPQQHTQTRVREGGGGDCFLMAWSTPLGKGNKIIVIHSGSESGPTAWTLQEFKGEGFSLSRPKGLTMACQLVKVWGQRAQWPTFPKQFLLCSLRVCKAHVLPVAVRGGGSREAPVPMHLPGEGKVDLMDLVLRWSWAQGQCLPGSPEWLQMWHRGVLRGQHRQLSLAFGKT